LLAGVIKPLKKLPIWIEFEKSNKRVEKIRKECYNIEIIPLSLVFLFLAVQFRTNLNLIGVLLVHCYKTSKCQDTTKKTPKIGSKVIIFSKRTLNI